MSESNTKRYIKKLLQLPTNITFWGTIIALVYIRVLYNNVYSNK